MPPDGPHNPAPTKRKRLQGACDNCRRKKARCDSSVMPDKICSNCIALGSECTHLYANQKHAQILNRTPLKTAVEGASSGTLGQYRDKMNGLLQAVLSSTYQAPSHPAILRDTLVSLARYSRALEEVLSPETWTTTPVPAKYEPPPPISGAGSGFGGSMNGEGDDDSCTDDCDDDYEGPSEHVKAMFFNAGQSRFYGPSGTPNLLATTLEFSKEYARNPHNIQVTVDRHKRPLFWNVQPWDSPGFGNPGHSPLVFIFPEPELISHLTEVYFARVNLLLPILHRPTFERSIRARLYLSDPDFGACLLAVCALAARHTDDRRVYDVNITSELGCGHQWFRQVETAFSFTQVPTLYIIQAYFLAAMYAYSTSTSEQSWYFMGQAIRAAQDIGLHRQSHSDSRRSVQGELRVRMWWALVIGETLLSMTTGRPPSIQAWEYNIDMPMDCDDLYWENTDPVMAFTQPLGKPSTGTYFVKLIELYNILGLIQRSLYFSRRSQEKDCTMEFDSRGAALASIDNALQTFEASVPAYLRIGVKTRDHQLAHQGGSLWMTFYFVQMMAHRPFISRKHMRQSSLDACSRAARACSRIMDGSPNEQLAVLPAFQMCALSTAALVLLIDIWRREQPGANLDKSEELRDVHRCILVLKRNEMRNAALGRRVDLLLALLAANKLPLPVNCGTPADSMEWQHEPLRRMGNGSSLNGHVHAHGHPTPYTVPSPPPPQPMPIPSSSRHVMHDDHTPPPQPPQASGPAPPDAWLDLLTDPDSLRARSRHSPSLSPGSWPHAAPPPPSSSSKRSSGSSKRSSAASHSRPSHGGDDRRHGEQRYHPFNGPVASPPSYPHAAPHRPSGLRSVHGAPHHYDVEHEVHHRGHSHGHVHGQHAHPPPHNGHHGGPSNNNMPPGPPPPPASKRGTLTRVASPGPHAMALDPALPGVGSSGAASQSPMYGNEQQQGAPPPSKPEGLWRSPYSYDGTAGQS